MTRIQRHRLFLAPFIIVSGFSSAGIFFFMPEIDHNSFLYWGIMLFCVLYLIAIFYFNSRHTYITLSEAELSEKLPTRVELNNRFEWKFLLMGIIIFIIVLLCLDAGLAREKMIDQNMEWREAVNKVLTNSNKPSVWIFTLSMLALMIAPSVMVKNNTYIIDGDMLYVREYKFAKQETELTVPIRDIQKVSLIQMYGINPLVVLHIEGIERKLQCTSYPYELAVAILQRKHALSEQK